MKYMLMPLRRYADFRGRSRRLEFWMFFLFQVLVGLAFTFIFFALFWGEFWSAAQQYQGDGSYSQGDYSSGMALPTDALLSEMGSAAIIYTVASWIWTLALIIPNLAVTVRRLHDTDRSGWWVAPFAFPYLLSVVGSVVSLASAEAVLALLPLLPILGIVMVVAGIILLIFMFLPGTNGPNRFGPDPKAPDVSETFS